MSRRRRGGLAKACGRAPDARRPPPPQPHSLVSCLACRRQAASRKSTAWRATQSSTHAPGGGRDAAVASPVPRVDAPAGGGALERGGGDGCGGGVGGPEGGLGARRVGPRHAAPPAQPPTQPPFSSPTMRAPPKPLRARRVRRASLEGQGRARGWKSWLRHAGGAASAQPPSPTPDGVTPMPRACRGRIGTSWRAAVRVRARAAGPRARRCGAPDGVQRGPGGGGRSAGRSARSPPHTHPTSHHPPPPPPPPTRHHGRRLRLRGGGGGRGDGVRGGACRPHRAQPLPPACVGGRGPGGAGRRDGGEGRGVGGGMV